MFNESPAARPALAAAAQPVSEGWPTPWRILYGLYAWLQFVLIGMITLVLLGLTGPLARRRALVGAAARLALRLAGMRVQVIVPPGTPVGSRLEAGELPTPCVVVANHCSYLDGVLLAGVLPASFSFVIKREMSAVPFAGMLLRRIGVEFMERRDQGQVLRDTRRVLRQAAGGQALVFFPEGTFGHQVGLLRFHIGAFTAATRARLPLVPLAIYGTRRCLPPGSPWPRPGRIQVRLLAAIAPAPPAPPAPPGTTGRTRDSAAAAALRAQARAALLQVLDEPDLNEDAPAGAPRAAAPPP
jgi:1-acyl-sn-glycerol-3-phosphate acyltransferase